VEMEEDMTIRLQVIVNDAKLTREEKIKALQGLYSYAIAEQPGAADSPILDGDALAETLQHIERALQDFDAPVHADQNPAASG
jgi:hypothetical protein